MRMNPKSLLLIACSAATSLAVATYGLFHGGFDHGTFEMRQVQWFSSKQVAMVAERSDKDALGGLEFYVLVGNHLFTPAELRHAYYSDAVILRSACNCLVLHWDGPNRLIIKYDGLISIQELHYCSETTNRQHRHFIREYRS